MIFTIFAAHYRGAASLIFNSPQACLLQAGPTSFCSLPRPTEQSFGRGCKERSKKNQPACHAWA